MFLPAEVGQVSRMQMCAAQWLHFRGFWLSWSPAARLVACPASLQPDRLCGKGTPSSSSKLSRNLNKPTSACFDPLYHVPCNVGGNKKCAYYYYAAADAVKLTEDVIALPNSDFAYLSYYSQRTSPLIRWCRKDGKLYKR